MAETLRVLREGRRLTQLQLAELVGATQSIVARWETGDHEISMRNLARLAVALRVDLCVHFGLDVEPE